MLEEMKEMIAEQLNCEESSITETTSFKDDLGADSLDLFELVMALEDEYNLEIPAEELNDLNTVGDVIEYFAMDASHMTEIMNREENVQDLKYSGSLKSDNKEEITWNKKDEVYDFLFYKNIEGIPVAWAGAKSNNVNYSNACYVRVVVGEMILSQ